jgi:hypothetical protein
MEISGGVLSVKITTGGTSIYMSGARRFWLVAEDLDDLAAFNSESEIEKTGRAHQLMDTVLASVVMSYTAVEAVLNELFEELTHFDQPVWFRGLDPELASRLNHAWSDGVENLNPIDKAKIALAIAHCSLDWSKGAAQDFRLLQILRNALIHHKPKSVGTNEPPDKLEAQLAHKFELTRIWEGKNVFFRWGGALGAGCAKWAYATAESFQAEFFGALSCDYPRPWPLPCENPIVDLPNGS